VEGRRDTAEEVGRSGGRVGLEHGRQ
jgi:hypothetical protein